jgi:hypothetical protein
VKITYREATLTDAHDVSANLSDINRNELEAMYGKKNWWEALRLVKDFLVAGPADAIMADGKVVAVFGHMRHKFDRDHRVTWFLAKPEFYALGVAGVLFARRYLLTLRKNYPGIGFYTYSHSDHPDAGRWFELIGFRQSGLDSGHWVYVLPMEAERQSA